MIGLEAFEVQHRTILFKLLASFMLTFLLILVNIIASNKYRLIVVLFIANYYFDDKTVNNKVIKSLTNIKMPLKQL
jgi:hypothetical protein